MTKGKQKVGVWVGGVGVQNLLSLLVTFLQIVSQIPRPQVSGGKFMRRSLVDILIPC